MASKPSKLETIIYSKSSIDIVVIFPLELQLFIPKSRILVRLPGLNGAAAHDRVTKSVWYWLSFL